MLPATRAKDMKTNVLQILNENYNEVPRSISLKKWVELESQSDPNFFRFFFDSEFDSDFGKDLTDKQREEFQIFLNSLNDEHYKIKHTNEDCTIDYPEDLQGGYPFCLNQLELLAIDTNCEWIANDYLMIEWKGGTESYIIEKSV